MKTIRKRITSLLLIAAMTLMTCVSAFALPATTAAAPGKGINVMVDGKNVPFGTAIPKIINGRTMVPFRTILEYLGATVSYDAATKEIVSTLGDKTITFKAGSNRLALKDAANGNKNVTMDVTPYLDQKLGSTYVSARLIAEAFSLNVGWDAKAKTVIIIDFKKLFKGLDQEFTIISKLSDKLNLAKTYKSIISMNYVMEILDQGESKKIPATLKMTSLQKGSSMDGTLLYSIDMSDAIKSDSDTEGSDETALTESADESALIEALKNLTYQIKMDGKTFDMYFKCSALDSLPSVVKDMLSVDGNTWIRITMDDLTKIYSQIGINIDFKKLMQASSANDLSGMVDVFTGMNIPLDIDTYASISDTIEAMKATFGDKAFKVTKSGNQTTYEMSASQTDAKASIFSGNIKFTEKNGVLGNYKTVINFNEAESGVVFGMDVSGTNAFNGTGKMSLKVKDTLNYNIDFSSTVKESSETFTSVPSSDEKVVDLSTLLSLLMGMN